MDEAPKKPRKRNQTSWEKGGPSPNPAGRAGKGKSRDHDSAATRALDQPVYPTIDGKRKKLTAREGMAMRLASDALKGDKGAIKILLSWEKASREARKADEAFAANYPVTEDDLKTIDGICARIRATPPPSKADA